MTSVVDRPSAGDASPDGLLTGSPLPEPRPLRHPNLSGDLLRTLTHDPVFRRAVVGGYDRFQVDAYVQWAEDELASSGRQRAELVAHLVRTRTELDEARALLAHAPAGADFLRLSERMGALLASAADQADAMRADGEAEQAAASARARRLVDDAVAEAERVMIEAAAEAGRMVADANAEAERVTAEAGRMLAEAEDCLRDARAEAAARLEKARAIEQRAREEAAMLRSAAEEEAQAARLQARADVIRLLEAGRQQRRRSDDEAAAVRDRLDREAEARRAALLAQVRQPSAGERTGTRAEIPDLVPLPRNVPAVAHLPRAARTARGLLNLGRRHAH